MKSNKYINNNNMRVLIYSTDVLMNVSRALGTFMQPAEQQRKNKIKNYRQMCMDRRVQECLLFIV